MQGLDVLAVVKKKLKLGHLLRRLFFQGVTLVRLSPRALLGVVVL